MKKGSSGLGFENFSDRINSLINFDMFQKPPVDFKEVSRLTVSDGEMQKKTIIKSKFSQINDKRIYFTDTITSLQLSHPHLKELADFKIKKGAKNREIFLGRKRKPIRNRKQGPRIRGTSVFVPSDFDELSKNISILLKRKFYPRI